MFTSNVESTKDSFSNTINTQAKVSYGIEKASIDYDYTNKDILHYEDSEMKINLRDNILLNRYFNKIKNTSTKRTLTDSEKWKYNYRPELLSTDIYGTPELWYLILKLNYCEDFYDFKDLDEVILPDMTIVQNCLTNNEYINDKDSY